MQVVDAKNGPITIRADRDTQVNFQYEFPTTGPVRPHLSIPEVMCQRDKDWASIPLGVGGEYTIGSSGCALCCLTMIVNQLYPDETPDSLQAKLLEVGGFWRANLNWAAIEQIYPEFVFKGATNWDKTRADKQEVLDELARGPVPLWVDFRPGGEHDTHFVVAVGESKHGDILIYDPWLGAVAPMLMIYGLRGWDVERAIYGMRPFEIAGRGNAAFSMSIGSDGAREFVEGFDNFPEQYAG